LEINWDILTVQTQCLGFFSRQTHVLPSRDCCYSEITCRLLASRRWKPQLAESRLDPTSLARSNFDLLWLREQMILHAILKIMYFLPH
jgi:hypothetical protein